jgi:hypothetical protein
MRCPLIALLIGYTLCTLFGLALTYANRVFRAICETPGCGQGPVWKLWVPSVTFAVLFTAIYLVWGRSSDGNQRR